MTVKKSERTQRSRASSFSNDVSRKSINPDSVIKFLKNNKGFLLDHPELLEEIEKPSHFVGNVVDIQQLIISRLREENTNLRNAYASIVDTARSARSLQNQIHEGVLQIVSAPSFERLIHTVTSDLPITLGVDSITICLEAGDVSIPREFATSLRSLPDGTIDRFFDHNREVVISSNDEGDQMIFGAAAGLIRYQALVLLKISPKVPRGLLAIGSRSTHSFQSKGSTDFVTFLARSLEITIRQWLSLHR